MDTFDYILILTWFWLIMLGIKVLELNKANKELAKRVGFLEEELIDAEIIEPLINKHDTYSEIRRKLELDTDDEEK